jgi:hypothetical protein
MDAKPLDGGQIMQDAQDGRDSRRRIATLTIIAGLPGSGKSWYIAEREASDKLVLISDDFLAGSGTWRCADAPNFNNVVSAINSGADCIIADIAFCFSTKRSEVEQEIRMRCPDVKIEYVYFENDPEKCVANVITADRHDTAARIARIREYAPRYDIPDGVVVRPVS